MPAGPPRRKTPRDIFKARSRNNHMLQEHPDGAGRRFRRPTYRRDIQTPRRGRDVDYHPAGKAGRLEI